MGAGHEFGGTTRFEIRRQLGAGAMGVVYEAFDREKAAPAALKTLKFPDAQSLYRFKREFRALQGLEHPNLVSLGELIEADGEWFFTMELLEGVDFLTYVRGEPWAPIDESQDFAEAMASTDAGGSLSQEMRLRQGLRQLALGISAVHAAAMIHRDIKPSNVIVTGRGRVVLLDFGLVRDAGPDGQSSSDNQAVGTASYMAPEQAISGEVGPAADWYSMGVVLYEALTGRLPHVGSTALDVLMKKQSQPAIEPRHLLPQIAADLNALCVDLLAFRPQDRPIAAEILERLGAAAAAGPPRALSKSSASSAFTQSTPFVGRKAELARLKEALDCSRRHPVVALVEGESGMGKSELVQHFAKTATAEVVVLSGRCYERESLPYKALDGIADALSRYLARLSDEEVAGLMPVCPGYLSQLFPVLKRVGIIAGAPFEATLADAQDQREQIFDAFRAMLYRLARRHPLVLVIDDLQWTDADSLTLLQEVLGHQDAPPLLLLASMRPLDSTRRASIDSAFESVNDLRKVSLLPLPAREAQELAALLLPGQSDADLSSLVDETGGHPLFIRELANHGLTKGSVSGISLEASLWGRISALPVSERRLLQVVCAAGSPISQEVAQVASELIPAAFSKASSLLRLGCLVRTDGSRPSDSISSYHNRVSEIVTARQAKADNRHCHERLMAAFEDAGARERDPERLLFHAEAAGQPTRAAAYALRAAERAQALMAFDQAADFYQSAFTLGNYEGEARRKILRAWADGLANAGRGPEAAERFVQAAEGAEPSVAIECRKLAAEQWIYTGHLEEGLAASELLLASVGEKMAKTPRRALASLVWNRFRVWSGGKRYTERPEDQINSELLTRLDVLKSMGHGLSTVDNIRGADFTARFLVLARRAGEPVRLAQALGSEAAYLATQGGRALRRGRRLHLQVAALADAHLDSAYLSAYAMLVDGNITYFEGHFARAASLLEEAGKSFASHVGGATWERNNSRLFLLFALRHLGEISMTRELSRAYLRDAHRRGDRYLETTLRVLGTEGMLARRGATDAETQLEMASWTPLEKGFHLQHWYELEARAAIALFRGRAAEALTVLAERFEGLARSQLLRVQIVRVVSRWLRARLLLSSCVSLAGPARRSHLRAVSQIERQLAREKIGYARVYALLVRGGRLALDSQPATGGVEPILREAIEAADANDMALCGAAARWRLGAAVGGDEGLAWRTEAEDWLDGQGVVNRQGLLEVVLPGFAEGGRETG